ncbi:polyhydroxyalkanoic acid system family protein [Psychrobacter lutiphocae]|uniref:polyhydroxyalkanoic acid system family protein n=1 Tax=Psychrobacter lutiphocae TaxID=540500 RepID=UPI00037B1260|nr:polyhydroxyalkanoic acid system family protein [Psychrobacter lutiphocae]
MADIEIEKEHNFDFNTAREQAKKWLESAKDKFGIEANYIEGDNEDQVTITRKGIDGKATLDANKIRFEATLGFLAKPLKGKIKEALDSGLSKYFN